MLKYVFWERATCLCWSKLQQASPAGWSLGIPTPCQQATLDARGATTFTNTANVIHMPIICARKYCPCHGTSPALHNQCVSQVDFNTALGRDSKLKTDKFWCLLPNSETDSRSVICDCWCLEFGVCDWDFLKSVGRQSWKLEKLWLWLSNLFHFSQHQFTLKPIWLHCTAS